MTPPDDVLVIEVEYNTEDEEYGQVYIARNKRMHLIADGKTFDELLQTLPDAIAVCLENTDTIAEYNLIPNPRVEIHLKMDLPHGKTA